MSTQPVEPTRAHMGVCWPEAGLFLRPHHPHETVGQLGQSTVVLPCCLSAQYVSRTVRWPTAGHILDACPELLDSSLIGPSRERGRSPSDGSGSTSTPPGPSVFLLPRLDQTSPPIIGSRHAVNAAKIRHHVQIGRGPAPGILKGPRASHYSRLPLGCFWDVALSACDPVR